MSGVTDAMLVAYVDGELDEINRRRVERAVAEDERLARRIAAHRRLRESLSGQYQPIADQPVPDRFRSLIAAGSNVASLEEARAVRKRFPLPGWPTLAAIAASLVLGLAVGRGLHEDGSPVGIVKGQMVAQGDLAHALDTQLASMQDPKGAVRIGVTFRSKEGDWCRSFDGDALSGVACRGAGGWQLEQAVAAGSKAQQGDYRQASSGDPRIMTTVNALIAGDALDGSEEKAARDAGWAATTP
jgi:hypothetical protein